MLPGLSACTHHRKTLSIRLLAVGFNNLDGRSGLFRPALLQTCCDFLPVPVSGTRTGSRAVAQIANGWQLHGNPCACLIPAREPVLVITLLTLTGSRVPATAYYRRVGGVAAQAYRRVVHKPKINALRSHIHYLGYNLHNSE